MHSHHSAFFNLREIIKQMILLEQHYSINPCLECMLKHLLTIEALTEEAATLDNAKQVYQDLKDIAMLVQKHIHILTNPSVHKINFLDMQHELRSLRRAIMQKYLIEQDIHQYLEHTHNHTH